MKVLNIVRHAKSSWDNVNLSDFERPLTKRGIKNAGELAQVLNNIEAQVDLIVSSAAERAITTAELVAQELTLNPILVSGERFYNSNTSDWLETIHETHSDINELMLVGHQPILSSLINTFINEPIDHVITCSCTRLYFNTDEWGAVNRETFSKGVHYNRHNWEGDPLI